MIPLLALGLSFVLATVAGRPLIARLRGLALQQTAYEDAPKTHQVKTGTPTMGGIVFIIAPLLALILAPAPATLCLSIVMIGCGLVGMVDDVAAIRKQRNRGLSARAKFIATIGVAVLFLVLADVMHILPTPEFRFPEISAAPWIVAGVAILAILGSTHAVNLTDGLDGLAGGSVLPPLIFLSWFSLRAGLSAVAVFDLAVVGAVLGFLVYNRHPAQVFMGDTGALALGAALAGSAVLNGTTLALPLVGAVFVAEALSVILQVASFKTTGKRIFRMSPLHHHFELGGMSEVHVTRSFWVVSTVCSLAAIMVCLR